MTLKICSYLFLAFNCLRTWGITHQWLPTILVLALSLFDPAINIVSVIISFDQYLQTYPTNIVQLLCICNIQNCVFWPIYWLFDFSK